jgi:hypothetical protein
MCIDYEDCFGEVSERLIEPVSKTGVLFIEYRGFESRPLRLFISLGEKDESHFKN